MGDGQHAKEAVVEIPKKKAAKLQQLAEKLGKMSHVKRYHYFKKISKPDCHLISEVALNFLNGRIQPDFKSFTLLKRCAKQVKILASKTKSLKFKRKTLQSIQGLQIIAILLPLIKVLLC